LIILIGSLCFFLFYPTNLENKSENYTEKQTFLLERTGYTNETESNLTSIYINKTNLTRLSFTLTWVDYSIGPGDIVFGELDEFIIEIFTPENESIKNIRTEKQSKTSRVSTICVDYTLNPIPNDKSLEGKLGLGRWWIKISCLNAMGIEYSCDCPSAEPIEDNGNSWTLTITGTYYESKIQ
jgi:hypothetical protein